VSTPLLPARLAGAARRCDHWNWQPSAALPERLRVSFRTDAPALRHSHRDSLPGVRSVIEAMERTSLFFRTTSEAANAPGGPACSPMRGHPVRTAE